MLNNNKFVNKNIIRFKLTRDLYHNLNDKIRKKNIKLKKKIQKIKINNKTFIFRFRIFDNFYNFDNFDNNDKND